MTDAHALTGLKLFDRDGFALQAVENALMGGTTGDIATMRHLCERSRDIGAEAALLMALAGLDPDATAIARGEVDGPSQAVRHALSLVGLHGVDPYVALAIMPVMDDSSVDADLGPYPGSSVAWWDDDFTVWTPGLLDRGLGITTARTVVINAILPESVVTAIPDRPLADLVQHAMILDGLVVESAVALAGATTIHLRRERFAAAT